MLIKMLTPDFIHTDERGTLTQLVCEGYRQFNIIHSMKDAVRGGHYHKENNEAFYVISGKFTFTAEKDGIGETHTFTAGDMFAVPKLVKHSFVFDEETWLASMYDKGVEKGNGEKDIFSE